MYFYIKCQIEVEICHCDTDAPDWGHCMRKKHFSYGIGRTYRTGGMYRTNKQG